MGFISILKTRSLKILFILSSVQKFIPLVILYNIIFNYIVFYIIVFLNLIILVYILFSTIFFNNFFSYFSFYVFRRNTSFIGILKKIYSSKNINLILLYFYLSRLYFFLSNLPMIKIRFKINFINFKKLS